MDNEKKQGVFAGAIAKLKKVRHIEIIIAVVAVIIMLLIYFSTLSSTKPTSKNTTASASELSNYCSLLEDELQTLISSLSGAGNARVLISWESSIELILAESTNSSSGSSSSTPIIVSGSGPVVLKEIYPKAVGALIICQGGNDPKIKVNIIMAVSTLLDISPDKVMVYAMTK